MNLGFDDTFVPFVEDGTKTHSVRGGNRWEVGMRADLYARPRQKGMRLLFRAIVIRVERIVIECRPTVRPDNWPSAEVAPMTAKTTITIDGNRLDRGEVESFAWRDGFRGDLRKGSFDAMLQFWSRKHGFGKRMLRFEGQVIHWDYEHRFQSKDDTENVRGRVWLMMPLEGRKQAK